MSNPINLSLRTTGTLILYLAVIWFLFIIRDVVAIFVTAIVLSAALNPTVSRLERRGVPRALAILSLYVFLAGLVTIIVLTFAPVISQQFVQLINNLPSLTQKVFSFTQHFAPAGGASSNLPSALSHFGTSLFQGVKSVINGIASFVAVLVLTFYLSMDQTGVRQAIINLAPKRWQSLVGQTVTSIETRLGHWLRGQLLLGLIIGTAVGIGLFFLHVKFALALGVIAGITELIPTVGPYIGMAPAALVAYSQQPTLAIWTIGLYVVIQQLENNLLVPRIMSRAAGVNPVVVLIALLIGARLAGIVGILLSVPIVIIGQAILDSVLRERMAGVEDEAAA